VLRSDYDTQVCSVARALEVVGERWTLLVLRDIFLGNRRFDAIQRHLGVARNVLQSRLERLLEHGVIEKVPYQERPVRHEYRLTPKGIDLWPTIVSLLQWGDRHALSPAGRPVLLRHKECGGEVDGHRICTACGMPLEARDVRAVAGPGAAAGHPLLRRESSAA
jgi:DNA-binding HxlR family transcriptional regulator